jgi:hypothetical protein
MMLTKSEIRTLNRARDVLKRAKETCGGNRRAVAADYTQADGYSYGIAAEAAGNADQAIFNVLNVLNAHRVQVLTEAQIHNKVLEEAIH